MLRAQVLPEDAVLGQSVESWLIVLVAIALVLLVAVVLTWALLKAGSLPPPTALVTALSVLTLFAMAGGIAQRGNEAWTIAAAGVGALAGSVTAIYTTRSGLPQLEPPAPSEPPVGLPEATPAPIVVTQSWKYEEPNGQPPKSEPHWDD
jgi:hypothetical protein